MPLPQPPKVITKAQPKKGANPSNPQGTSSSGGGQQPVSIAGSPASPCLISYPSASVPLVGTVGGGCILSKTNVRAMVGGLLIGAGGILFLGGVVVLVAAGFKKTGALDKVAGVVGVVPGGQPAAAGLRAAGRGQMPRRPRPRPVSDGEAQLGEPRENPNLRVGQGAVRETPAGTRRRRTERTEPATREEAGF